MEQQQAPSSRQTGAETAPPRVVGRLRLWLTALCTLLAACSTPDSATSSCLRNPSCYTVMPGEEAIVPTLSRAAGAARTAYAAMKLLEAADVARVEQTLVECAEVAERKVNERHFGPGGRPDQKTCREVVGKDAKGRPVTRAARLGDEKHQEVADCVQRALGQSIPENYSWEPTYLKDWKKGELRWISPQQVAQWLSEGLEALLLGTLVPDLVLHATANPLKIQRVYDFKFPCIQDKDNPPRWSEYPPGSHYYGRTQGEVYGEILGGQRAPALVAPGHGVR